MLTIDNFNKDLNQMMVWGWDLVNATEFDDTYLFMVAKRAKPEDRVLFTLGRVKQSAEAPYYPEKRYQLYFTDEKMEWTERMWLNDYDVKHYKIFLALIEGVLEKHYGHA
jgi:hypothetical protein